MRVQDKSSLIPTKNNAEMLVPGDVIGLCMAGK